MLKMFNDILKFARGIEGTAGLIKTISGKEISMKDDEEWNRMSEQDSQILALVTHVESLSKANNSSSTTSGKRKRTYEYPEWKLVAPKDDESKEKVVDKKTYYWCSKCRDGKGLWSLHPESKHTDGYKQSKSNADSKKSGTPKKDNKSDNKKDETPSVTVDSDLLKNAKAYLSRYADSNFG